MSNIYGTLVAELEVRRVITRVGVEKNQRNVVVSDGSSHMSQITCVCLTAYGRGEEGCIGPEQKDLDL